MPKNVLNLTTESDVEQKVVMPLLTSPGLLGIPVDSIHTKEYLPAVALDKNAGKSFGYYPDYSIWQYGLPVMIVEVKAPGVSVETGYREASLYARHLNQNYISGCNPCNVVLATNGEELLCGTWDAQPTLRLRLEVLEEGNSASEELRRLCAFSELEASAKQASSTLKAKRVFVPVNSLGGQTALTAQLPFNSFAAELSPILKRYFSSNTQENVQEIVRKAYISSNEATEYDHILESLLKDRASIRQDRIAKTLQPTQDGEPNVAASISYFKSNRPETGQLQIVQGSVGAGKSLFIRRYKDSLQNGTDKLRTRWAFIDFNNVAHLTDSAAASSWLYSTFCEAFQAENPSIDLASKEILEAIFARNIKKKRALYQALESASPTEATIARVKDLMSWQDDPKELARGIAEYVLDNQKEVLVTVMDNVDRLDVSSQLSAFQLAISFMSMTKCFVILQMRDETYERFKTKPPLDTFRSGVAFHITPPRFIDVVKRRLELSLEYLSEGSKEVVWYSLESGLRIKYPKSELGKFLTEVYVELFEKIHNSSRVLEALAGRDVRRALEMFVSVLTSGHLSASSLSSGILGGRTLPIREHSVLKILMRTNYQFASDHSGYTTNILWFDQEWERPDNFILVETLFWLITNRKRRGEIGLEGYFRCRTVANEMQKLGYMPSDSLAAVKYLLRKQLVIADHLNPDAVSFDDSVKILAAGFMHLQVLAERLEYLYGILPTTPFFSDSSKEKIITNLGKEQRTGKVLPAEKAASVLVLLEYLKGEHRRRRASPTTPDANNTGSAYLLRRMERALAHFRGENPRPDRIDPLNV